MFRAVPGVEYFSRYSEPTDLKPKLNVIYIVLRCCGRVALALQHRLCKHQRIFPLCSAKYDM